MNYLAWRNLKQSRTQFILGVGGVALALLLMLSLDALLASSEEDFGRARGWRGQCQPNSLHHEHCEDRRGRCAFLHYWLRSG